MRDIASEGRDLLSKEREELRQWPPSTARMSAALRSLRGGRSAGAARMHGGGLRARNAGAGAHALGSTAPAPLLDLGKGWPSFGLMPHAAVAAAAQRATTPASLHYAPAQGHARFREAVAALLNAELSLVGGREVLPDNLMLTSGASTGLALAAMAARPRTGDVCLVETGTYWFAHRVLLDGGFTLDTVAHNSDGGLDLEDLERHVVKPHVKALYLVPTFSNPRGTTIPASQRREIVRLCRQHGVVVFADEGLLPVFSDSQTCGASFPAGGRLVTSHFWQSTIFCDGRLRTLSAVRDPHSRRAWRSSTKMAVPFSR
jgi:DNA-binding transcriptional MocR family regulator